jgi:hypothetical protein
LLAAPIEPQTTGKGKIGSNLTVTDSGNWRAIQKGVEYRKLAFERSEPSSTLELKLLRLDAKIIAAKVLTAADLQLKVPTRKRSRRKAGAFAAINANYFDDKGRALAYLKLAVRKSIATYRNMRSIRCLRGLARNSGGAAPR